jgi:hypothetical protein
LKGKVFARQWAHYDLAKPGTFRLPPTPAKRLALARDYAQMRAMFLSAPPGFEAVLDTLGSRATPEATKAAMSAETGTRLAPAQPRKRKGQQALTC